MDSQAAKEAKFQKLCKWAENDAAFLQNLMIPSKKMTADPWSSSLFAPPSSARHEHQNYSCGTVNYARQRFLRSYPLRVCQRTGTTSEEPKTWMEHSISRGRNGCSNGGKRLKEGMAKLLFSCAAKKVDVYDDSHVNSYEGSAITLASPDLWIYRKRSS